MFGFFKKKSAAAPAAQEPVAQQPVEQAPPPVAPSGPPQSMLDWHGEISQIHNEFVDYLQNAVAESQSIVATVESELGALAEVWDPAERKLDETTELLRQAWKRHGTVLRRDKAVTEQQQDAEDLAHDTAYSELEIAFQEGPTLGKGYRRGGNHRSELCEHRRALGRRVASISPVARHDSCVSPDPTI